MSGSSGDNFTDRLRRAGLVAILTLDDRRKAVPLAKALCAGGLKVIEVVLRTPSALDCIKAISNEVADCDVGAGTITKVSEFDRCQAAGASFMVSPGFSTELLREARDRSLSFLPGVSTAAEALQVMSFGFSTMKLFPSELLGGPEMCKSLQGPFSDARFCCTGGIALGRLRAYRARPNVVAVGASFMASKEAIAAEAWGDITTLTATALRTWMGVDGACVDEDHRPLRAV
jgi:2-dehydro-3-deoxyphosphogluconate aldolase/(4S)-4-hydroxy-2-oxoglutarate aldolase